MRERGRLGTFEFAGVLGRFKAGAARKRAVARGLASLEPACARRRGPLGSSSSGDRRNTMSLNIYPVILDLVRRLAPVVRVLRSRSSALGDQMERALISVPLNTAEGAYSRGKNRQARFQSAAASARETLACLETAEAMGFIGPVDPELAALFHRVIGTLVRLTEPRR